jgi:hypothetical protein
MEVVGFVKALLRRKVVVALLLALALLAAILTSYKISSNGIERKSIAVGAATSQILIDSAESTLVEGAGSDQIAALGTRSLVYAQYLSSRDAVDKIGRLAGIDPRLITAAGPFSEGTGISNYDEQAAESRAKDLVEEGQEYRLLFQAREDVPIITVYSTAPDTAAALSLAKASYTVLQRYIAQLKVEAKKAEEKDPPKKTASDASQVPLVENIVVRELGAPEGGLVGGSADYVLMILAFVGVLGLGCLVIALASGFMRQWRLAGEVEQFGARASEWLDDGPPRPDAGAAVAEPEPEQRPDPRSKGSDPRAEGPVDQGKRRDQHSKSGSASTGT